MPTATTFDPVRELLATTEPGAYVLVIGAADHTDLARLTDAGLHVTVIAGHGSRLPTAPDGIDVTAWDARHLPLPDASVAGIWVHRLGDFDQQATRQVLSELARVSRNGAQLLFTARQALVGAGPGSWETTAAGRHWVPLWRQDDLVDALLSAQWVPHEVSIDADPDRPGVIFINANAALL